eukprot:10462998-Alexandrium_andersonii.AAC.1
MITFMCSSVQPSLSPRMTLPACAGVVTVSVNSEGVRTVCGGPKLKGTENYPDRFGYAVARVYKAHCPGLRRAAQSLHVESSLLD